MKKLFQTLLVVKLLFVFTATSAQQWMTNAKADKAIDTELSFFDIQKSFENFWAPMDVKKGYYFVKGEKIKAAGWKQFKRWEWFWNDRVNPQTGVFPKTSAFGELQNYLEQHPNLKSTNGGSTGNWSSMGPSSSAGGYAGLGRLNCVAFSPDDNAVIYAGAASGGIWKSLNNGESWAPIGDNNAVLGVSDLLVVHGQSGDIIYAATGDRDASDNYSVGILKSIDGGNTWKTTGLNWAQSSLKIIYRLLGDPTNVNVVYAATSDGLFVTSDSGYSWTKMTSSKFINIKFKPGSSQVMYGSTTSTGDIYRSTNGGVSWGIVLNTSGSRVELDVSPANPEVVYAVISSTSNGLLGVYRSTTSGESFSEVSGSTPNLLAWSCDGSDAGGQGWYDLCLVADPANADNLFVGGINTWKSTDGGSSWTISNFWSGDCGGIATSVHADKHYFAYQPGTSTLFECNDGGLYKTTNSGVNWIHLGSGQVISQMYRLGVSQTNPDDVICGLQDNGTKAMISKTWKDVIGGDGMECLIDYTNTNVQYGELYYGDIYRTDNRWSSSTYITGSLTGSSGWVTPYVIDPNNPNTLYVGYQDVWKTTNKGASWVKISNWSSATLRSLAVAPSNSAIIYAATGSVLNRTNDGGATWTNITGSLPVGSSNITYVTVGKEDPNSVWVSLGQFNAYGVFQSKDGGVTWTDISAGLPLIPVNCVIQNTQNTTQVELYAGTDVGVFIKLGDDSWTPFFTGLPNVVVMELEIYYANDPSLSRIRAATYGRGLWESDVYYTPSVNSSPVLAPDPIVEADATAESAYSATLADHASDANTADVLTFTLISGPEWIKLSATGALSGTPPATNVGLNSFVVKVDDGKGGSDQASLLITVNELPPLVPVVDFLASELSIIVGQSVEFTDLSINFPTEWMWNFGDGKISALQNPSNIYMNPGVYTVVCTARNISGSGVKTRVNYISVKEESVLSYCEPSGIVNSGAFINSVSLGGTTNVTGQGASGYILYDSPEINLIAGKNCSYSLVPSESNNRNFWNVWIDFNQDGDFDDAGENVLEVGNKKGKANGSMKIPSTAGGMTRLRVSMRMDGTASPCENSFNGEVEDYVVNIRASSLKGDGFDNGFEIITEVPELKLYPNPVINQLNIAVDHTDGNAVLRVFSLSGAQLDLIRVDSNRMQIDVSRYPSAVYYVAFEDDKHRVVRKFVKD